MPKTVKRPRPPSDKDLRDAVVPFARRPREDGMPVALLALPPNHLLVSSETFRVLMWGANGHRDACRNGAPWLTGELAAAAAAAAEDAEAIPFADAAGHRDEWHWMPVAVPTVAPRAGHVYVMSDSGERIPEAGELYHRVWIEEGVPPKQVPLSEFEAAQAERRAAFAAGKDDRRRFGETALFGVKLRTIKTKRDGDCFFSSVCKAFIGGETWRDAAMSRTTWERMPPPDGAPPPEMPPPSEPPTVEELRRCCGAHFDEEMWLTCQAVGGAAFAFICDSSLEETRSNIACPAGEARGSAHWADEISLACVQRYLNVRFLIFNPAARPANQLAACGPELPRSARFVLLRHTHRGTKEQHYELYALGERTIFDEAQLPLDVKCAFARVCPGAESWRQLQQQQQAQEGADTSSSSSSSSSAPGAEG